MDSDSDGTLSNESERTISSYELADSSSENNDLLTEQLDQHLIDEWQ